MTPEPEQAYRQALTLSLAAGNAMLKSGGSSIDAVIAAIVLIEDSPLFNAGKGGVFSYAGCNELDASIMEGSKRCCRGHNHPQSNSRRTRGDNKKHTR